MKALAAVVKACASVLAGSFRESFRKGIKAAQEAEREEATVRKLSRVVGDCNPSANLHPVIGSSCQCGYWRETYSEDAG